MRISMAQTPHGEHPVSPFFIVGCGRSGTTLLRNMLNNHPQIAIPVESLFIVDYLRAPASVPITVLSRLLVNDYEFREWGMPIALADLEGCLTARDLIDRIHELYATQQGKAFWGQKTPRFVRHGRLLKSFYPQARFIHVLRDPRAVASSLMRSNLHRSNVYYAAKRWDRDIRAGLALGQDYPDDVVDVYYEDLVISPAETLEKICAFLGIDFHPDMLIYHRAGAADFTPFFNQIHARLNEPPNCDRIEAWRNDLSPRQVALIEALCADMMRMVGYTPDNRSPTLNHTYVSYLKAQRLWGLSLQILHRLLGRFRPLFSFVWRKARLGLLWHDLAEVNY